MQMASTSGARTTSRQSSWTRAMPNSFATRSPDSFERLATATSSTPGWVRSLGRWWSRVLAPAPTKPTRIVWLVMARHGNTSRQTAQAVEKGPDARRRAPRHPEAYFLYVEGCRKLAPTRFSPNGADGPYRRPADLEGPPGSVPPRNNPRLLCDTVGWAYGLEGLYCPGQHAAKTLPGHPPPRLLERAQEGAQPGLFKLEVSLHRPGHRRFGRRLRAVDQEMTKQADRHVRVVQLACVILHGDQRLDSTGDTAPQRVAEKLQEVPEPLAFDPQDVDRLDGRPVQHRLVRPHPSVVIPDLRGQDVADQMGLWRVVRGGVFHSRPG